MAESTDHELFEQVIRRINPQGKLLRFWPLMGGVSAQVTGLEIELPDGHLEKMIVRRHGAVDLQHNPHIAAEEFALLQILQSSALPTPVPYHLDETGTIFPTPYLVVEFIDGEPEFAPPNLQDFIRQIVAALTQIHQINGSKPTLNYLPKQMNVVTEKLRQRPDSPDESLDEGRIREILGAKWPLVQVNPSTLLHGDFWPGNILWKHGQLLAVVDWEDALLGDPLADLAYARLEILWAFGHEAMQDFTERYRDARDAMPPLDFRNLPFWDLWAALRPAGKLGTWGLDPAVESQMRERHKAFVNQALANLRAS